MTLNDVMAVILRFSLNLVNTCVPTHNRVDLWRNLCTSLLYFVVRTRCRRKESSRSLSHLLMSFLLFYNMLNCRRNTFAAYRDLEFYFFIHGLGAWPLALPPSVRAWGHPETSLHVVIGLWAHWACKCSAVD